MISFLGSHIPKDVILHAVFFYLRYSVSYRDLEKTLAERGVVVDHATLIQSGIKYAPPVALRAHLAKLATNLPSRMDEAYAHV